MRRPLFKLGSQRQHFVHSLLVDVTDFAELLCQCPKHQNHLITITMGESHPEELGRYYMNCRCSWPYKKCMPLWKPKFIQKLAEVVQAWDGRYTKSGKVKPEATRGDEEELTRQLRSWKLFCEISKHVPPELQATAVPRTPSPPRHQGQQLLTPPPSSPFSFTPHASSTPKRLRSESLAMEALQRKRVHLDPDIVELTKSEYESSSDSKGKGKAADNFIDLTTSEQKRGGNVKRKRRGVPQGEIIDLTV